MLQRTERGLDMLEKSKKREILKSKYEDTLFNALNGWLGSESGVPVYNQVIKYLESTDFFDAPASTRYHENYASGLVEHSLRVAELAEQLCRSIPFGRANVCTDQAVVCALIHDFCKINYYEPGTKNVKDEKTGKWETMQTWQIRNNRFSYLGHGEDSVVRALKVIPMLTSEMLMAIRWHMGLWDCSNPGQRDFGDACRRYPLVHLIQFADLLSTAAY